MTGAELLDVAMCRLRLPVPMAKLQMIHQVADALKPGPSSQATWQALLRWLRSLKLESEVLEALAIVVMARRSTVLSSAALRAAIDAPSVLSDVFIGHAIETHVLVHSWLKGHSGEVPHFHRAPQLMEELERGVVVPKILIHRMQDLERRAGKPFVAQWTYEFERLLERTDNDEDGHFSYFLPSYDRAEAGQFTARRGHLARSALLRTFALACDQWQMPIPEAQAEAMFASPADLSMLPMLPGEVPPWAQALHSASPGTADEAAALAASALREVHEGLGRALLHLNLPLHGDIRYQAELEIVSVLTSDESVDVSEALHLHDWLPGRVFVPRADDLTLRVDPLELEAAFPTKVGGFLRPVLLPLVDEYVGYLHADLMTRMPRVPSHNSETQLIVVPRKGGADVLHSGQKVGELQHWNWKWRPTHPKGMDGHMGVALVLLTDMAERILHVDGMRLAHVWRTRVRRRETDYGDWIEVAWEGPVHGLRLGT